MATRWGRGLERGVPPAPHWSPTGPPRGGGHNRWEVGARGIRLWQTSRSWHVVALTLSATLVFAGKPQKRARYVAAGQFTETEFTLWLCGKRSPIDVATRSVSPRSDRSSLPPVTDKFSLVIAFSGLGDRSDSFRVKLVNGSKWFCVCKCKSGQSGGVPWRRSRDCTCGDPYLKGRTGPCAHRAQFQLPAAFNAQYRLVIRFPFIWDSHAVFSKTTAQFFSN